MKRVLNIICFMTLCVSVSSAWTADKVVVIPLGGMVGNASTTDVVKGKTFSSSVAGKGATGALEYTEFCEGKDVGAEAFKLDIPGPYEDLYFGDIFSTDTGKLVKITSTYSHDCTYHSEVRYRADASFLIAPDSLPDPNCGETKGVFYYIDNGEIAFADFI